MSALSLTRRPTLHARRRRVGPEGTWSSRRWATALGLLLAAACLASTSTSAEASPSVGPGPTKSPVTLTKGYTLSGFDVATSTTGTGYIGWIANTSKTNGATRAVHLCEVKPGTTSCAGGIQVVGALGIASAEGLRVLLQASGIVDLVWFYNDDDGGGHIGFTSTNSAGKLQPATDAGSAPNNGELLDAEIAPDRSVWTVAGPSSGNGMQVRPGVGSAATNVTTPYEVGYAELAFTGQTAVIATQQAGSITGPAGYTYESNGSWSAVKNVAHTWTAGARVGLADSGSGLRLVASVNNSSYAPVVAKWTGTGFSQPTQTGDHNSCSPESHDLFADASGRVADIAFECSEVAVTNMPDTVHAAVVRFSAGGTTNAGPPRIATTPRGYSFAVWSIEDGSYDQLLLAPVLLPDLTTTTSQTSSAGSVTVTGPVSCLPADDIAVGVKGTPAKNWHVSKQSLKLGSTTVGSTLKGATLTAGKAYTLTGQVTFADGGASKSVTDTLTFLSCPTP
jgi:hypothetical protein